MARRVLFVAWAPYFSGAERALLLTLRSLDPSRYTPSCLPEQKEFAAQVREMGVPCRVSTLSPLERRNPFAGVRSIAAVLAAAVQVSGMAGSTPTKRQVSSQRATPRVSSAFRPSRTSGFLPVLTVTDGSSGQVSRERSSSPVRCWIRRSAKQNRCSRPAQEVLHDGVEAQPQWSAEDFADQRRRLGLPERRPSWR